MSDAGASSPTATTDDAGWTSKPARITSGAAPATAVVNSAP